MQSKIWYSCVLPKLRARANQYNSKGCNSCGQASAQAVQRMHGISGGGGSMNSGKSKGTSQQFAGRELLTPDEVMRLGPEKPIVLVKGEYPYLLDRLNYLADAEYAGLFDANPYHS